MANLGPGELLLITVVLLLVFGTSRLPALGDALGRALRRKRPGP
jgi:TatA/E family protein of Tat protein translocase